MYGEGLSRLLERTADTEASGITLIESFADDDLLGSLLFLHGLHPIDIETRIVRASGCGSSLPQIAWRQCRVCQR